MPVTVYVNGRISWQAPAFLKARCEVDISNFPFDKQTCEFVVSITVAQYKMNFTDGIFLQRWYFLLFIFIKNYKMHFKSQ